MSQTLEQLRKRLIDLDKERKFVANQILIQEQQAASEQKRREIKPLGRVARTTAPVISTDKVELFLELFRCRESVYPKRWENPRTNKQGYSPACENEWHRGVCEKPKIKCGDCKQQ